jgi:hypothetical protein
MRLPFGSNFYIFKEILHKEPDDGGPNSDRNVQLKVAL